MLIRLFIQNYVLLKKVELKPEKGFTAVTGETGAGKSILMGALNLLCGQRADIKSIWKNADKCIIEAEFDISEKPNCKDFLETEDLYQDQQVVVRREILSNGKSRAFINDTPTTLDKLQELGNMLIDIHSQHDTLLLAKSDFQLQVIDNCAQTSSLKQTYQEAFELYQKTKKQLTSYEEELKNQLKEQDYKSFVLQELQLAELKEDEIEILEGEYNQLDNVEEIKLRLAEMQSIIDNDAFGIGVQLAQLYQLSNQMARLSDLFLPNKDTVQDIIEKVQSIKRFCYQKSESLDSNPERLNELKQRLDFIHSLLKKHQKSDLKALIEYKNVLETETLHLDALQAKIKEYEILVKSQYEQVCKYGDALSQARRAAFEFIINKTMELCKNLNIHGAQFDIQHTKVEPNKTGIDSVQMVFSANQGVQMAPIKQAVSGGEFSRLMFALKYIMAEKSQIPTLIFDEIDTGISGEVAAKMGDMMREMAAKNQIFSITHAHHIAGRAHHQWHVSKIIEDHETSSQVNVLTSEQRISEIARIIGGNKPSQAAIEQAKQILTFN